MIRSRNALRLLLLAVAGSAPAFSQISNSPGPPLVTFTYVDYITRTSAELVVTVIPKSNNATAWFEWGTTADYGDSTVPTPVTYSNSDPYASYVIVAPLTGLPTKTIFHARGVAVNDSGRVYGPDISFITMPPEAVTLPPDSVTMFSA